MAVETLPEDVATASATVTVQPLSVHIGAEISGVDLTQPLTPEEVKDIRSALVRWKVIFFRDQIMDHRQHIEFGRQFGELTPGHKVYGSLPDFPEIYSVAKHRKKNRFQNQAPPIVRPWSGWHTDITAAINPPAGSILRGDVVPPYGGDTQFTNLVAAYNALSPTMQEILDGLRAVHRFAPPPGMQASKDYEEMMKRNTLVSEHPLIRVHPESGERVLFVSPSFLKSIVGMSPRESQVLIEFLWEHIVRTEFTVRFKWEPGSIAFWDNRSTCHLAPTDIYDVDFERDFYRVTLVGDVPVGVDGKASTAIEGEPILAV